MAGKKLVIDLETTGLDFRRERVTVVGGYYEDGTTFIRRGNSDLPTDLLPLAEGCDLGGHNFKFDLKFIYNSGVDAANRAAYADLAKAWKFDTKLMASICATKVPDKYLAWYEEQRRLRNKELPVGVSHRPGSRHSLKVLAPFFLGVDPFWEDPTNHDNDEYVLKDCKYTYDLYEALHTLLYKQDSLEFADKLLGWEKMLLEMEITGIALDKKALAEAEKFYTDRANTLRAELNKLWRAPAAAYQKQQLLHLKRSYEEKCQNALQKLKDKSKEEGTIARYKKLYSTAASKLEPFNYDSPGQMLWLLRDYKNYDVMTFEGKESTNKEVLNRLAKEGHEDVKTYLDWRKAQKILTMYLPTYKDLQVDGVINPYFNSTGTRTGRLSCREPNLQQVPGELYKLFKPRDGYKFVVYDLSGIEAALIALYTEDPALYEVLSQGISIHNKNAKVFFNLDCDVREVDKLHPKERKAAKTVGFALFYGAGWRRIKASFMAAGYQVSDKDAKAMLKRFKETYQQAFDTHEYLTSLFEKGEIIKNIAGRPVKIQVWENPYMQGFNTLVQSSASDLNIRACQKARDAWQERGIEARPLLLIHDCIVAEAKADQAAQAADILVESMTSFNLQTANGPLKLQVEGGVSDVWEK